MKTLFIASFFIFLTQTYANELTWVDEQVEAIKPARVGVSFSEISRLKDPFIFLVKNGAIIKAKILSSQNLNTLSAGAKRITSITHNTKKPVKSKSFKLRAIINGSALINSKWYKLNQKIRGYTVAEIKLNEVVLTKNGKKLLPSLSTNSNILNLKFKSK